MAKKRTVAAILCLTAAAVLAGVAAARPTSTKQRVSIMNNNGSFVLAPKSSGPIQGDSGTFAACCWTRRYVTRSGQRLELDNPQLTLTGKNGTLKIRNHIVWVDLPDGWSVFTGTWKLIGGTGAYAGLSGRGSVAAAESPGGYDRTHLFGFLGK